jgi:hypothetical protein
MNNIKLGDKSVQLLLVLVNSFCHEGIKVQQDTSKIY